MSEPKGNTVWGNQLNSPCVTICISWEWKWNTTFTTTLWPFVIVAKYTKKLCLATILAVTLHWYGSQKPKQTLDQPPHEIPLRSNVEFCAFWVAASALAFHILTARDVALRARCQTSPVTWHRSPLTCPNFSLPQNPISQALSATQRCQTLACRLTLPHRTILITAGPGKLVLNGTCIANDINPRMLCRCFAASIRRRR